MKYYHFIIFLWYALSSLSLSAQNTSPAQRSKSVQKDMDTNQVQAIMGRPDQVKDMSLGTMDYKRWVYNPGSVFIDFQNGKVVKIVTEEDRQSTKDMFKPVQKVMQVDTSLHGQGDTLSFTNESGAASKASCQCRFQNNALSIQIKDEAGKTQKMKNFYLNLQVNINGVTKGTYFFEDTEELLLPKNVTDRLKQFDLKLSTGTFTTGQPIYGYFAIPAPLDNGHTGKLSLKGHFTCTL